MQDRMELTKLTDRTLTVRGTGRLSVKPDLVVVNFNLIKKDKDYSAAMRESAKLQEELRAALEALGFKRTALTTSSFNVNTEYESVRGRDGVFHQVFSGYVCYHRMRLEFPFDTDRLSEVLSAISDCVADPELDVQFTVKDKEPLVEQLLKNACENALSRAKLLAGCCGVTLRELVTVDYSFANRDFVSPTNFVGGAKRNMVMAEAAMEMDIEAQNIDVSESVTFVWRIA